ncbi:hypothetical protein OPV22_000529 [Ensete ventricosum]|uniref:Strictosidine synthase conserved region domain-containing protein n=1 Tax=Ensete ventricosum TaxID=4639 RepID=A0AAV8QB07_ENSVE|nr:hypothetical protein OPV22_000529 [Ensete ventricosum]
MRRWISVAAAVVAALLGVAAHVSLYSPISPLPLRLPVSPLTFTPNNLLQRAEKLGEGRLQGPEDVYVDGDGTLYTASRDGWIKRMHAANRSWEDWRLVGGSSLLGLTLSVSGDDVLICDADKGLLKVGKEEVVVLASEVNGSKIRFADDVIEASDGSGVYFSDASTRFGLHEYFLDLLEARPNGRLLKFDPSTKETTVVLADLAFPNGVALSSDQDFLVVCETWRFRCLKHWLKGKKTGETEVFIDNLPGGPDNIKLAPDGSFWIAVLQFRSKGMDLLHRSPTAKKVVAAFPKVVKALQTRGIGGMVMNVGSDGKIRRVLDDSDGKVMSFVTSAMEFQGYLYVGSLHSNFVGKFDLRSDHPL